MKIKITCNDKTYYIETEDDVDAEELMQLLDKAVLHLDADNQNLRSKNKDLEKRIRTLVGVDPCWLGYAKAGLNNA